VVTDSRASLGAAYVDIAPKLASVRVRISGPRSSDEDDVALVFERSLGIAVIGSLVTSQSVLGVLRPILERLNGIPTKMDGSLNAIVQVIAEVLKRVSRAACEVMFERGVAELLVLGECPVSGTSEAYHLKFDGSTYPINISVSLVDVTSGPKFFGSGAHRAERILLSNPKAQPFRIVKEVCLDNGERTVGGAIQYGAVYRKEFVLYAVQDYEPNGDSGQVEIGHFIGGVELSGIRDAIGTSGMALGGEFIRPFLPDVTQLEARNKLGP
jgi:hypothetical protein